MTTRQIDELIENLVAENFDNIGNILRALQDAADNTANYFTHEQHDKKAARAYSRIADRIKSTAEYFEEYKPE